MYFLYGFQYHVLFHQIDQIFDFFLFHEFLLFCLFTLIQTENVIQNHATCRK